MRCLVCMKHRVKWLVKQDENGNETLILNKMVTNRENWHKITLNKNCKKYHKIGIKTLTKQDCKVSHNWYQESNLTRLQNITKLVPKIKFNKKMEISQNSNQESNLTNK